MKTRVSTILAGAASFIAVMALLPHSSRAQPGDDGSAPGGGQPGDDGSAPGAGASSATIYCAENGSDAHYEEFLAGTGETMVRYGATLTSCPNHVNWPINPNSAGVFSTNESMPAYPMLFADSGTTDLSESANNIGIMLNGVAMYSSWAVTPVVTYEDTAFYLEADTFDPCGGHATAEGGYHYHGTAGCLQEQAGGVLGQHSPLIGWAYDGFPFYGQLGPGGVEMKICGFDGADATYCLDACSGYEGEIDADDFKYRYYTSCGFNESFFPFTANCFRGCCPDGVTCNEKVEACGTTPENGYTDAYVPVASESLDEMYDATLIEGDDEDIIDSDFSVDCSLYLGSESFLGDDTTPAPSASATTAIGVGDDSTSTASPGATSDTSSGTDSTSAVNVSGASKSYDNAGLAFFGLSAAAAIGLAL